MVKQYELMVLLPSSVTIDEVKAFKKHVEKLLSSRDGKVDDEQLWGKRKLAYVIKKQPEAYYILYTISLDTTHAQAFEREIRLTDNVMRSLFLIKETHKQTPIVPATIEEVSTASQEEK